MMSYHIGAVIINDTGQANELNRVEVNNFSLIELSTICATSTL